MSKIGRFLPRAALIIMMSVAILVACNQPYSQSSSVTNTPINPTSFFPASETPDMDNVASFGTSTPLALSGIPQAIATPTLLSQLSGALTFSHTASSQTYGQVGQTIAFTYIVTNAGTVLLGPAQFTVSDTVMGIPFNCGPPEATLAPGQTLTCSALYTITQADLSFANKTSTAIVSAGGQTSAPSTVTVTNLISPGTTIPFTDIPPTSLIPVPTEAPIRILFDPDATTAARIGILNPNERIQYILAAVPGQTLTIHLATPASELSLGVSDPSGVMLKSPDLNYTWSAVVNNAGDYTIYLESLSAGAGISYMLEVNLFPTVTPIPGDVSATPPASVVTDLPNDLATYQIIAPLTLKLNESFIVELLMSRSLTEEKLLTEIVTARVLATSTVQPGTLVAPGGPPVQVPGGQLLITPFMRVKLEAADREAFDIRELHTNPIQVVNENTIVKWQWVVQAKKNGMQNLIFYIEQQALANNDEYWYSLAREERVVQVNVPFMQRLDWKWIISTLIILALVATFWRWVGVLQKESEPAERSEYKWSKASRQPAQKNRARRLSGPSRMESTNSKNLGNIFISYRRSDSADIAGRIYDRLVNEFGSDSIFKDVDSIPLGVNFKSYIDETVGACNVFLAIIGDRWLDAADASGKKRLDNRADFVRAEIASALKKEIPVIPLLVRGAYMPEEEQLPYSLRRLVFKNGISIRPDPDFHRDMDRLISALQEYM
jgi:hypothetical protein